MESNTISIQTIVGAPLSTVWKYWTTPADITRWNHATDDWHCPYAENDLCEGGKFNFRMEARDGSMGFNFVGLYDSVLPFERIAYTIGDGRKVEIRFAVKGNRTEVVEIFEVEHQNPAELQRNGWYAILENFRKLVEAECS